MSKSNKYDSGFIERYLLDKVSEEEKAAFQFELIRDRKLKEELNDMRRLQKTLVAESRKGNSGNKGRPYGLWGLLLLVGIGCTYLAINYLNTEKTENLKPPEKIIEESIPQKSKSTTEPKEINDSPEKNNSSNSKNTDQDSGTEKNKETKQERPMAVADPADLVPNPYFENLISGVRSADDFELEVTIPKVDAKYKLRNGSIKFGFQALAKSTAPSGLIFSIYDNKESSYENEISVFSQTLKLPINLEEQTINIAAPIKLSRGLYYYVLENEEEIYALGKFTVY